MARDIYCSAITIPAGIRLGRSNRYRGFFAREVVPLLSNVSRRDHVAKERLWCDIARTCFDACRFLATLDGRELNEYSEMNSPLRVDVECRILCYNGRKESCKGENMLKFLSILLVTPGTYVPTSIIDEEMGKYDTWSIKYEAIKQLEKKGFERIAAAIECDPGNGYMFNIDML